MQRVDFDELDLDLGDRSTYSWQGRRFTGIAYGLRPDGTLWDEIAFVDGKKHGLTRQWHPSGRIESETAYYRGTTYGPDREWDEAGQLRREAFLEYGYRVREKRWDEAGTLTLDYEMGTDHPNYPLLQKYRSVYDKHLDPDLKR